MSNTFDNRQATSASWLPAVTQRFREITSYSNALSTIKTWRHRSAKYHDVYDVDYFQALEKASWHSAPAIARIIVEHINPVRVVDLGCGTGNLLDNLRSNGVKSVGADFSEIALAYCDKRGLEVKKVDFAEPQAVRGPLGRFDLAVSLDVIHQLPKNSALSHLAYLCHHADTVLFAAPESASDRIPKFVRSAEYWIEQFEEQGFQLDYTLSAIFMADWPEQRGQIARSMRPMVFQRNAW